MAGGENYFFKVEICPKVEAGFLLPATRNGDFLRSCQNPLKG
jgi:hypothetical protein